MSQLVKKVRNVIQAGGVDFNRIPNSVTSGIKTLSLQEGEESVLEVLRSLESEFLAYRSSGSVGSGMAYDHQLRRQCWYRYHKELLQQIENER